MTIEVRDSQGRCITAEKCLLGGLIAVTMPDSKPIMVDPQDPDTLAWLKIVFTDKLEYIL